MTAQSRCLRAGADAFVVKAVQCDALVAIVRGRIAGRGKPKARGHERR
jgi:DNA-binding NarL/FixJ family response regulator